MKKCDHEGEGRYIKYVADMGNFRLATYICENCKKPVSMVNIAVGTMLQYSSTVLLYSVAHHPSRWRYTFKKLKAYHVSHKSTVRIFHNWKRLEAEMANYYYHYRGFAVNI